jgi:uncharacterized protein YciI
MTDTSTTTPLRREIRVACGVDSAFELFTAHIAAWWPLGSHSVFGADATVAFEDGVLVERHGTRSAVWGSVLSWDRPHAFSMSWHPGRGPEAATEVAVAFAPDGDSTVVTLTHTGWERLAEPTAARAEYASGWLLVLAGYGRLVEGAPSSWFVLRHAPGPALRDGGSVFTHPLFPEHVRFLDAIAARGWLVAAGPVDPSSGAGMAVLRVPTSAVDEALALAQADGAVTGELLTMDVQPWDVRFPAG